MREWQRFAIPELLLKALKEQSFYHPTEIQAYTLPAAILGKCRSINFIS